MGSPSQLPKLHVCECICACVCVCGGSEGPWKSKNPERVAGRTGYPRLPIVVSLTGVHVCINMCVCVYVYVMVCTSSWGGATALGTHMSRCQQLRTLGSSVWAQLLKGSTLYIRVYTYIYIYILTGGLPSQLAEEVSTLRPLIPVVLVRALTVPVCADLRGCQSVLICCTHVHMYLGIHVKPHYWLDLGNGTVQPHLYQATGFGFPNTVLPAARSAAMWPRCVRAAQSQGHPASGERWSMGSLGTSVPSSSLTHKQLLKLSSSSSPCQILCVFLDSIKCRFLVCHLWVRETYTSMSVALMISLCCPATWLVWMSALVYGLAYVIPVSFSSTADFSRNGVQGRTAFPL